MLCFSDQLRVADLKLASNLELSLKFKVRSSTRGQCPETA
jgi:hypothetical protein